jgi:hypothetical protein
MQHAEAWQGNKHIFVENMQSKLLELRALPGLSSLTMGVPTCTQV